jgi:HlyD family secretion protein
MRYILKKLYGWKLPSVALMGFVFALMTVFSNSPAPANEPAVTPPTSAYESAVAGIGVIEPQSEIINIGTELSGIIRKVHVKIGSQVKAGDLLFTLDERDIDAQIKTFEANLASATVQAKDARAQFDIVKSIKDKRAISKDDYNRRQFAAELADTKVKEIEAQLTQLRTTKDRLNVTAPMDGEILSLNVRAGEFATAGVTTEPLIRMGDTSRLHVRVEIDEENAGRITQTAPAKAIKRGSKIKNDLTFVRYEPFVRPKQNLSSTGQRVDTRVLQIIYALPASVNKNYFIGEQVDVFVEDVKGEKEVKDVVKKEAKE